MKTLSALILIGCIIVWQDFHDQLRLFDTSKASVISEALYEHLNDEKVEEKLKLNERALHAFPSEGSLMTKIALMELSVKDAKQERARFKTLY